jgi:hypothetical protein
MTDNPIPAVPISTVPTSGYTLQVMNDTGLPPHSFIILTGPDGIPHGYGLAPIRSDAPIGSGLIWDNTTHPFTNSSAAIPLTPDQYSNLAQYINASISTQPDYNLFTGHECTNWVYSAVNATFGIDTGAAVPPASAGYIQDIRQTLAATP